ncbi:hypothetical protein J6590_082326 [Homalodisca vitripennis]|nr:hypothetical protein J6590_082326 [Homalodisca vitripennis]
MTQGSVNYSGSAVCANTSLELDKEEKKPAMNVQHASYNSIKTWIQGGNSKTPLGPTMHMIAAAEAGVLTLVMTNPVWVVKTRLCLQYGRESDLKSSREYYGMMDALRKIYKVEGVRGLYKVRDISDRLCLLTDCACSTGERVTSRAAESTRYGRESDLKSSREYYGMMDALRKIYKVEGVRGLYKVRDISDRLCLLTDCACSTGERVTSRAAESTRYGRESDLKSSREYYGMMDALRKIYKVEGVRGLYKYGRESDLKSSREYYGMMDALRKIYKVEGVRGLYKHKHCPGSHQGYGCVCE